MIINTTRYCYVALAVKKLLCASFSKSNSFPLKEGSNHKHQADTYWANVVHI